jgi:hypothetical protein
VRGRLAPREAVELAPGDGDGARVPPIERADHVQQRRLAHPRGPVSATAAPGSIARLTSSSAVIACSASTTKRRVTPGRLRLLELAEHDATALASAARTVAPPIERSSGAHGEAGSAA